MNWWVIKAVAAHRLISRSLPNNSAGELEEKNKFCIFLPVLKFEKLNFQSRLALLTKQNFGHIAQKNETTFQT